MQDRSCWERPLGVWHPTTGMLTINGVDRLEQFQELGGAAGELAALLDQIPHRLGHGVRVGKSEGLAHFLLGAAKGGAGGHGPGERVGATSGGRVDVVHTTEGDGDGGAQRGDDFRPGGFENG